MSRPESLGVPYFPLVTEWDKKLKLIQAKYKLKGIGCVVELLKTVYAEGYALRWDEDAQLLFADEKGIELEELREIVEFAVEKGIFDRRLLVEKSVLSSHGIQKQWLSIVKAAHRKNTDIDPELCLLSVEEQKVENKSSERFEKLGVNEAAATKSSKETPQSKAKQSKVNSASCAREGPPVDKSEEQDFDEYCLRRAKDSPGVKNPKAYARKLKLQDDIVSDWRTFRNTPPPPPPRCAPPDVCPSCGSKVRDIPETGEAFCPSCKRSWNYDSNANAWREGETLVSANISLKAGAQGP